jgi:hypothetical protein
VTARADFRRASVWVSGFGMSQYFTELKYSILRVDDYGHATVELDQGLDFVLSIAIRGVSSRLTRS